MAHYRGKSVVVLYDSVDISGDGRSVSYEESSETHDTTKYGDDNRTKIAGLKDGSGSFEGLDTTGAWSAVWAKIAPGSTFTMEIRPEGTLASNRKVTFTAIVTNRSLELPYDDLAKFSMSYEISGAVVEATQ